MFFLFSFTFNKINKKLVFFLYIKSLFNYIFIKVSACVFRCCVNLFLLRSSETVQLLKHCMTLLTNQIYFRLLLLYWPIDLLCLYRKFHYYWIINTIIIIQNNKSSNHKWFSEYFTLCGHEWDSYLYIFYFYYYFVVCGFSWVKVRCCL